jgi:hypothetical protein
VMLEIVGVAGLVFIGVVVLIVRDLMKNGR